MIILQNCKKTHLGISEKLHSLKDSIFVNAGKCSKFVKNLHDNEVWSTTCIHCTNYPTNVLRGFNEDGFHRV